MKLDLKFMVVISSNGMDSKGGKLRNNVIFKIYGILLRMAAINFQRPDSGGIIHGRILKTTERKVVISIVLVKKRRGECWI